MACGFGFGLESDLGLGFDLGFESDLGFGLNLGLGFGFESDLGFAFGRGVCDFGFGLNLEVAAGLGSEDRCSGAPEGFGERRVSTITSGRRGPPREWPGAGCDFGADAKELRAGGGFRCELPEPCAGGTNAWRGPGEFRC